MDGRRWWNQESSFSRYLESCSPIQHKAFPLSPATQQNERKEGRVLEAKICHCSLGIPKCWQEVGASCNPCCMGGAPTLLSPPHPLGLQLKDKVSCSRVYRANPASHIVGFCVWTIPSSSKFLKRNQIVLLFLTSERNSIPKKSLDFHLHFHLFLFFFSYLLPFLYSPPLFCFFLHFAIDKENLHTITTKKETGILNPYQKVYSPLQFLSPKYNSALPDCRTKKEIAQQKK